MLSYIKKLKPGASKPAADRPPPIAVPAAAVATENEQQHHADGDAVKSPVLSPSDEKFLESALEEADDETHVILPGSETTTGTVTPAESAAVASAVGEAAEEAEKEAKREGEWREALTTRWEGLRRSVTSAAEKRHFKTKSPDVKGKGKEKEEVPEEAMEAAKAKGHKEEKKKEKDKKKHDKKSKEYVREEDELTAALDQLNLAAEDGRAFSVSAETRALLARFTQILKDLSTGVPTAYDDLTKLLESSSTQLESTFKNLPGFLQKLIKTLPSKLEPGVLQAAAAASPALVTEGGIVGLKELVTKPGLLMGLLKSVVNLLKTRFPALLGANAALSMGLFVVLLVLWYCHKRGREVRLEGEEKERQAAATLAETEREAETAAKASGTEGDLQGGSRL